MSAKKDKPKCITDVRNPETNATASGVSINHPNVKDWHLYLNTSDKNTTADIKKQKRLKLTKAVQTLMEQVNHEDTDEDSQE